MNMKKKCQLNCYPLTCMHVMHLTILGTKVTTTTINNYQTKDQHTWIQIISIGALNRIILTISVYQFFLFFKFCLKFFLNFVQYEFFEISDSQIYNKQKYLISK